METLHHDHLHHDHGEIHAVSMPDGRRVNRAFKIGILLNLVYVAVEAVFGWVADSMGLLSDAGHNLSDVASLVIALLALKMAQLPPTARYTYGYSKATVQASVVNSIILYVAVVLIVMESVDKLLHPVAVDGEIVAWVAGIGVLINGITAWLFLKDSRRDLNIKGAFMHMAADALVSVGVVVSGIAIHFTGWTLIDPIVGIVVAMLIALSSYSMLADSMRLVLDGVPKGIDPERIGRIIDSVHGVDEHHHLHIWPLSTTSTAMTVHVVVSDIRLVDRVITEVREAVKSAGITHSTIEAETSLCDSPRD